MSRPTTERVEADGWHVWAWLGNEQEGGDVMSVIHCPDQRGVFFSPLAGFSRLGSSHDRWFANPKTGPMMELVGVLRGEQPRVVYSEEWGHGKSSILCFCTAATPSLMTWRRRPNRGNRSW